MVRIGWIQEDEKSYMRAAYEDDEMRDIVEDDEQEDAVEEEQEDSEDDGDESGAFYIYIPLPVIFLRWGSEF